MDENVAEASTRLLHEDEHPSWGRLRDLLLSKGLDPAHVALANLFPDDTETEFGIVVTSDGHVYEFS